MAQSTLQVNAEFGPYHVERQIAVGGMAEIYLASTTGVAGFKKLLALKAILPDFAGDSRFVDMLIQEAKLAVSLSHPNIVQTFDLGLINDVYFISMEFVDGPDFFHVLSKLGNQDRTIPIAAAMHVVKEVMGALNYAHHKTDSKGQDQTIIHRDVSPQNIMLSMQGEVKLGDFGIAKAANATTRTRAGVIKGKLVYMAPEQAWGQKVDHRLDIFSAGVVLYEALTGASLYTEDNPAKLLADVRQANIPPPSQRNPGLSAEIDQLVMKALEPQPDDRYQSAREFGDALGDYIIRHSPNYSSANLASFLETLAEGAKNQDPNHAMSRGDFAIHQHSIVFSPGDIGPDGGGKAKEFEVVVAPPKQIEAKLVLLSENGPSEHPLSDDFVIGRTGNLRLADGRVSRRHARIFRQDGRYSIEDLNSSNGTFVNDQKLLDVRLLDDGDQISVGSFKLKFVCQVQPEVQPDRTIRAADQPSSQKSGQASANVAGPKELFAKSQADLTPTHRPMEANEAPDMTLGPEKIGGFCLNVGEEAVFVNIEKGLPLKHELDLGHEVVCVAAGSVEKRGNDYWISPVDGGSPMRINGAPLEAATPLSAGDQIEIGALSLEFQFRGI
jgi:serine/threonine protein kinase